MTQDAHLKIDRKTGSSKNTKQHAVGCEYIENEVNGRQFTVSCTACVCRELLDEFIGAHNGKSPWSTKAFVRIVREIEHHDVVHSGVFANKFPDMHPQQRTKQAIIDLQEATEALMVEVIAESHS